MPNYQISLVRTPVRETSVSETYRATLAKLPTRRGRYVLGVILPLLARKPRNSWLMRKVDLKSSSYIIA